MRSRALVLVIAAACSRQSQPAPATSATHAAAVPPAAAPSAPASPHTYAIKSDDLPDYVTNIALDVPAGWTEQAAGDKGYGDVFEPFPGERLLVLDGHHAVVRLAVLEYPHGRAGLVDTGALDIWLGADHQPGVAITKRPDGRYTITIHHADGSLHYVLYVPEPFAVHPFDDNGPGHVAVCEARLDASAAARLAEVERACDGMRASGQYASGPGAHHVVIRPKRVPVKDLVQPVKLQKTP